MKKILLFILCVGFINPSLSQEFNATVTIDARQTGQTRLRIFNILKQNLEDFINQTPFTNETFTDLQKIECSFFLTINSYDSDNFSGSIQVQANRPVFGSATKTSILNIRDEDFDFKYTESQPLIFDINSYQSNLTSVITFYLMTILGLDGDSFENSGGTIYHELARQIVTSAQSNAGAGWQQSGIGFSRFNLNNDLLSQNFSALREVFYKYHIKGLDNMHNDQVLAKQNIMTCIAELKEVNDQRPNSVLMRTFFDTKAGEIQQIFSGGPQMDISKTKEYLYRIAPVHNNKWRKIAN